ncbi:von willebrand factor type A domain protein (macronuclear) [Tetrahymena thermophila SB210]|uniref:von willebrand factor type A domain protein n=1 Tax=Tetrahymena thermophila (strain SB210) TaxID=312017 RepID=I7MAC3_TETTS|nr:von willebrand factor type A domain protein [Tetrahymena thermophila SB210]EAS04311.1 von willebrand factor type A domain protein [Tetrahymena thermophila SB210]|eukprot:XP_001024556.1 von willebrand factor type A domain protein [Tetrahymena thermophila SB210]
MGKSIKKDSDKSKKIQRQNTMEQTADEAKEFLANYDKILKRQQRERQLMKQKIEKLENSKRVKKSTKKVASLKKAKDTKALPASPKKTTTNKKKVTPTKIAASTPKTTKAAKAPKTKIASSTSVLSHSYPYAIQNDCNSCSTIASTEVLINKDLGNQIIKKSLKGQAKAEDVAQKKAKPLRTKTGEKLAAGMVDVVFCCDTTSSMSSYINKCKDTVNQIIKNILDKTQGEGISVKFGFVAYRDHPPQDNSYLTCSYDLTSEDEIKQFIQTLSAFGGGDYPEAVMDGLYVSAKHMSWRDSTHIPSLRYIFHITDAPPHGSEYGSWSSGKGCKCGIDINKLSHIINMRQIHYRLVSTETTNLQKMAEIFKSKIIDYEECTLNNASEMDIKISDMIIRELLPDMVEEDF